MINHPIYHTDIGNSKTDFPKKKELNSKKDWHMRKGKEKHAS